jgi:DNA methyltransferase 1-associated protein 1
MSSTDVRSILDLPLASSSTPYHKKVSSTAKRPDGISRELYALIGDNAPSLAEAKAASAAVKYRDRPKVKGKLVRWQVLLLHVNQLELTRRREWTQFAPSTKIHQPKRLSHWTRVTDEDPEASGALLFMISLNQSVAYFAQFDEYGPSVMEYSQYEYDQHLLDPDWTPHETKYLFDLLRSYDLRFVIAADRYLYRSPAPGVVPKSRTVEACLNGLSKADKSRSLKIATTLFVAD